MNTKLKYYLFIFLLTPLMWVTNIFIVHPAIAQDKFENKTYVLIMSTVNATAITTQEFTTQKNCNVALRDTRIKNSAIIGGCYAK